jgi:hypothetical protein
MTDINRTLTRREGTEGGKPQQILFTISLLQTVKMSQFNLNDDSGIKTYTSSVIY